MLPTGWLRKLFGDRGERAAVRYLRRHGFQILARQARSRLGEIDIIATEGDWVVFVEVKTRTSTVKGHPVEAVTPDKQRQLTRAALAWLKHRGWLERRCRFDVIAVTWRPGQQPVIEHFPAAFEARGTDSLYS
ncbi:MAG: YraN family protein [Planctomycetaceae bacterium]|nr:YraN family protein [Planctomycetaceae bacterium]